MIGGLGSLIGGLDTYLEALVLVVSVMGGSLVWWLGLSELIATIRHKLTDSRLKLVNRIAGVVLLAFGARPARRGADPLFRLTPLLRGALKRELAVMDAPREASRHFCDGILAIDADKIGERRKQGGIGEHLRLDTVMQRLFPGVEDVSERCLPLRLSSRGSQNSPR